jgi:hypothetical protein
MEYVAYKRIMIRERMKRRMKREEVVLRAAIRRWNSRR